jgi:hypothetical protein
MCVAALTNMLLYKNVEDFSKFFTETKEIGDFCENTNVMMIFAKTKIFCQNILIFTIFLYEAKTGQSHQYRRSHPKGLPLSVSAPSSVPPVIRANVLL